MIPNVPMFGDFEGAALNATMSFRMLDGEPIRRSQSRIQGISGGGLRPGAGGGLRPGLATFPGGPDRGRAIFLFGSDGSHVVVRYRFDG